MQGLTLRACLLYSSRLRLATVWRKCQEKLKHAEAQKLRLEEDVTKVPEMAVASYAEIREAFLASHPDVILADFREPHKRFLERLARDRLVHDAVLVYQLGEVRLRNETIIQKSGLASNAEQLLRIARTEEPAALNSEEDAMARIHAFFVALK